MTTPTVSMTGGGGSVVGAEGSLEGLMTDLLECSVCLEPLDSSHRVLPCQHTFCLACLEDLASKQKLKGVAEDPNEPHPLFLCPECRAEIYTPISSLPTNVILNRILSGLNQPNKIQSPNTTPLAKKNSNSTAAPAPPPLAAPPAPLPLAVGDHRKLPLPLTSPTSFKWDNNNIPGM